MNDIAQPPMAPRRSLSGRRFDRARQDPARTVAFIAEAAHDLDPHHDGAVVSALSCETTLSPAILAMR
jgi:hypothetical protein